MDPWLKDTLAEASRRSHKDPEAALELLEQAQARFPDDPTAWLKGARVAWQLGRASLAVEHYARGLALSDDAALAFEAKSLFYLDTVSEDFRRTVAPCFQRRPPVGAEPPPAPSPPPAPEPTEPEPEGLAQTDEVPGEEIAANPLVPTAPAATAPAAPSTASAPQPTSVAPQAPHPLVPTPPQPASPAQLPSPGAGRYTLGAGTVGIEGLSLVHQARDQRLQRAVTVEQVDLGPLADADGQTTAARDRVLRSLTTFAAVEHPNLGRIYDVEVSEDGRSVSVIGEWLEGVRLDAAITAPTPGEIARAIVRDLAAGLAALHTRGLVHGAVRPGHVFVTAPATAQQRAVLPHLGGLQALTSEERRRLGASRLESRYAAPEASPNPQVPTPPAPSPTTATDVYQLGLVWAELLAGAPVTGEPASVLVPTRGLTLPGTVLQSADAALVQRCLDDEPARRPTSAELLALLDASRSTPVPTASLAPTPPPTAAPPRPLPPIDVDRLQARIFQQDEGFVVVPQGTFTMGSPLDEEGRGGDETLHDVFLPTAFLLQITPFTVGQWMELMGSLPTALADIVKREQLHKPTPLEPIRCVSWFDAAAALNALSRREGLPEFYALDGREAHALGGPGFRLPTEAEWEYAARAGLGSTLGRHGKANQVAWYNNWSLFKSRAAFECKQKTPNAWGLHDMLGNVREWTGDWYGPYPGTRVVAPAGPAFGSTRVTRGGGWRSDVRFIRFASREPLDPFGVFDDVGFRPARTLGWGLTPETCARALFEARRR